MGPIPSLMAISLALTIWQRSLCCRCTLALSLCLSSRAAERLEATRSECRSNFAIPSMSDSCSAFTASLLLRHLGVRVALREEYEYPPASPPPHPSRHWADPEQTLNCFTGPERATTHPGYPTASPESPVLHPSSFRPCHWTALFCCVVIEHHHVTMVQAYTNTSNQYKS